jgi:AcrR family transcriptional regulator
MDKEVREQAVRDTKVGIILDAARAVFARKGFYETRLEDIAEAAGFSKASLYNYFESKEVIFLNLVKREHDRLVQSITEKLDLENVSWEMNLKMALTQVFSLFGEHFAFIISMSDFSASTIWQTKEFYQQHNDLVKDFRKSLTYIRDAFVSILAMARRKKEINCPLPDEALAGYIGSLVRGIMMNWKTRGKMGDIDQEVNQLIVFIKHGIQ